MALLDEDEAVALSAHVVWALMFGLLAWGAWVGVTATEWWAHPLGFTSGLLALWIAVTDVRKAWKG